MAGSAGSIGQYFPDIFGAGAPMSGAGAAATTTAGAGAGSMVALGPAMIASAGIQGLSNIAGGFMGQQSAREADKAAKENTVRLQGFDMLLREREKAAQMAGLREGHAFMQSPIYQQKAGQDFRENFMLSGRFDPYLTGMASRFRGV